MRENMRENMQENMEPYDLLNYDICRSWADDFQRDLYLGGELFTGLFRDLSRLGPT